jgi:hypothetical protein
VRDGELPVRRDTHRTMPYLRARRIGPTHFLMKRLPNVRTEMSLHVLAYNMKRAMQIFGVVPLMQMIRAY